MEIVEKKSETWYQTIINYLESFQVSANSGLGVLFETALGPEGKNISALDGLMMATSAIGVGISSSVPEIGLPLVFISTVTLGVRRGPLASVAFPLVVVTAISNPGLSLTIAKESAETLGAAAKGAVELGFQVSGLIVTSAGIVVGLVLTNKK